MSPAVEVRHYAKFRMRPFSDLDPDPALRKTCDALRGHDVFVDAGSLLGAVREGTWIRYDSDIDFAVIVDRNHPVVPQLPFTLCRTMDVGGKAMQKAYLCDDVIVDLYYYWTKPGREFAVNENDCGVLKMPMNLVRPVKEMAFRGMTIPVPGDPEGYLAWRYGSDWRTPTGIKLPWYATCPSLESK